LAPAGQHSEFLPPPICIWAIVQVTGIATPHWTEVWVTVVRTEVWREEWITVIWTVAIVDTIIAEPAHSFKL